MDDLTGDPQYKAGLANTSQGGGGSVADTGQPAAAMTAPGSESAITRPGGLHGVAEPAGVPAADTTLDSEPKPGPAGFGASRWTLPHKKWSGA
jgi:hypothetical protein